MSRSPEHGYPVHGDCVNFRNGFCTLLGMAVEPNGAACPRFTPKRVTKAIRPEPAFPEAGRPNQGYPMHVRLRGSIDGGGSRGRGVGDGRGVSGVGGAAAYPAPTHLQRPLVRVRAQEKEALTQQLEELEKQLKDLRQRMEKLDRG